MTSHDNNMTNLGKRKIEVEEYCTLAPRSAVSESPWSPLLQPDIKGTIHKLSGASPSDVSIQGNSYWLNFDLCLQVRNDCQLYA